MTSNTSLEQGVAWRTGGACGISSDPSSSLGQSCCCNPLPPPPPHLSFGLAPPPSLSELLRCRYNLLCPLFLYSVTLLCNPLPPPQPPPPLLPPLQLFSDVLLPPFPSSLAPPPPLFSLFSRPFPPEHDLEGRGVEEVNFVSAGISCNKVGFMI